MAREAIAAGGAGTELLRIPDSELSSCVIYEFAMKGDKVAQSVFDRVGRALGLAIGNMVNAVNIPVFVIGGGASNAWDAFAPALFDELRKRSYIYRDTTAEDGSGIAGRKRTTVVTRASLGGEGGLYGAARLPMLSQA